MDLRGKVALLTGAKRIGAVVAEELAKRGVDVALSYARSKDEAESAAERARAHGVRGLVVQAALADAAACQHLVDRTAQSLGRLDIVINMASVYRNTPFDDMTLDDWSAPLDVDLRASFLCAKAAVPYLRRQGGGRIVNFSDWLARSGRPRYPGYVA